MSRNRIPFGYTPFGGVNLVKLNVKISAEQGQSLVKQFPNIVHWDNGKYGSAIEGSIKLEDTFKFRQSLQLLIIDAKIQRLMNQKIAMLDAAITSNDFPDNEANFDLI